MVSAAAVSLGAPESATAAVSSRTNPAESPGVESTTAAGSRPGRPNPGR